MKIDNRIISINNEPFIIAEMSGNHNQSLDRALKIVEAAAKTGVHAIKLQTYTADTITIDVKNPDFLIQLKNSLWTGRSLYDLYSEAHTPWEWHGPIMKKAKELGLICFSTPFDKTAVDFLEHLNVPAYKIASMEITHIPLIKKVSETGKPIIFSTGMASLSEIDEAFNVACLNGCKDIVLLKCTSSYPASPVNSNINTIPHMRESFGCEVGLSDHTLGIGVSVAAVAHGASVIEKHMTLKRSDGGVDSTFSLEPHEMQQLVIESKVAWQSLGQVSYGPTDSEKKSRKYRQSIYITQDIKAGEVLSKKNIRIITPGLGLEPKYFDILLGCQIKTDVKRGTAFNWRMVL